MDKNQVEQNIKISQTRKEVLERMGLPYSTVNRVKLNKIIQINSFDISHFLTSVDLKRKYHIINKKCSRCNEVFQTMSGGKRSKKYCSDLCSRKRKLSQTSKKKISNSLKNFFSKTGYSITEAQIIAWKKSGEKKQETAIKKILKESFEDLSWERKRKRVIYEQEGKCKSCGNDHWLGKKMVLEIDHIDGDRKNNSRNNLEAICPNCHSLTKTWRGRNKRISKEKISDEILIDSLIRNNFNFKKSLEYIKLAPKGGNYNRCHRLMRDLKQIIGL